MKHVWTVLCSKSITDAEENSISLIQCVENIVFKTSAENLEEMKLKIKGIPANLELTSLWFDDDTKKKRELEIKVRISDSDNKELKEFKGNFMLPENMIRIRTRMRVEVLPVIKSGLYYFKVSFKGGAQKTFKEVAEIPLNVEIN